MLYSILPGLSICMSLLKGNDSSPSLNVGVDSVNGVNEASYSKFLDAATLLIQAAKQMKIREESSPSIDRIDSSDSDSNLLDPSESSPSPAAKDADFEPEFGISRCPNKPIDCEEILVECGLQDSGIYRIWPRSRVDTSGDHGFDVYCDMKTDGGGWTVFQRRDDFGTDSDFFYKDWKTYKYGFGHLNFDFWLGNDKIFALSNQRHVMLRFDLLDFADEEGYATYDSFHLDDESEGYRLHIGDYRGNIGDSFSGHNLSRFSTKDRDNDNNPYRSCAVTYRGGWWYNNCHTANLNGKYLKGEHDSYANGVNWHGWRGFKYSLKKTEMKLRSSKFRYRNIEDLTQPKLSLLS